jgi:hypothetical protein
MTNKIKNQLFGILKFGHCDLPIDLAQGGEPVENPELVEVVEPFVICVLLMLILLIRQPTTDNGDRGP